MNGPSRFELRTFSSGETAKTVRGFLSGFWSDMHSDGFMINLSDLGDDGYPIVKNYRCEELSKESLLSAIKNFWGHEVEIDLNTVDHIQEIRRCKNIQRRLADGISGVERGTAPVHSQNSHRKNGCSDDPKTRAG